VDKVSVLWKIRLSIICNTKQIHVGELVVRASVLYVAITLAKEKSLLSVIGAETEG
jgi:hypothetical protein